MNSTNRVTIGARHWDHVIPLALGDVPGSEAITLERRDLTPELWQEGGLDASETSFSRYVRARAAGDRTVTALPVFIMRGFRHRCILTTKASPNETAADLRGARIGLTGWPDSGNAWTRAILRRDGVGIADADWRVGVLTSAHSVYDRIGVPVPGNVQPTENGEPLVDMLERGALDAVLTPFPPPGFFEPSSPLRALYPRTQEAEREYYRATGYIPGIHLLGVKTKVLERDPSVGQTLVDLFTAAQRLAHRRRAKLLDVTPWQNDAFGVSTLEFGEDFSPIGWSRNEKMIADFQGELVEQGLLAEPVPTADLFPLLLEPSELVSV